MKKISFLFLFLCVCMTAWTQSLHLIATCGDEESKTYKWYIRGGDNSADSSTLLELNGGHFEGTFSASQSGFYHLYGANQQMQVTLPLYLPDAAQPYQLRLTMNEHCPQTDLDADNKALSAFNKIYYVKSREFWIKAPNMKPEEVWDQLTVFSKAADSIGVNSGCSESVKDYLKLWAYTTMYNNYATLPRLWVGRTFELPFTKEELLGDPLKVLDVSTASCFPLSSQMIVQSLPDVDIIEKFEFLHKHYAYEKVRKEVETILLDEYIRRFDYAKEVEKGLERVTTLVENYQLDRGAINKFKSRISSVQGQVFPADIILTDINGNKVDFSSFKGSYVYVDLWASWCGPCCQEAPYLIQLEKDLKNKKVKFVSISLDRKEDAWRKKMKELGLHGNQLLNQDNKLAEKLNVRGIPFFIIYDKEGKIYRYNAPRPSSEDLKELLENLQ